MDVKKARARLDYIAFELAREGKGEFAARINEVSYTLLRSHKALPRAPVSSPPMTPALAEAIRKRAEFYPSKTQQDHAAYFNVNQGRVSTACNQEEKRDA